MAESDPSTTIATIGALAEPAAPAAAPAVAPTPAQADAAADPAAEPTPKGVGGADLAKVDQILNKRATAGDAFLKKQEAAAAKAAADAAAGIVPAAPTEAKPQNVSILDQPEVAEDSLIALLRGNTDPLLPYGQGTPKELVTYSRRWLKLVGDELRAEVQDTLLKRVVHGMECQISVLGQVKDANKDALWLNVFIKEKPVEDDEAAPDPPTMHMIFLCADHGCAFYISGYSPNKQGDRYRAIALDVEALRQGHVKPPSRLPPLKVKCVELASAMTALARVYALTSIKKLDPSLAQALTTNGTSDAPSPWVPLAKADDSAKAQLKRLNPGQRTALEKLDGAIAIVQGPPGTGKSHFITAACLSRVPKGARILACTATNKAIDALVAKFEQAGVTQMLCVGSRRAMGEASTRYLMSNVLARDTVIADAEKAHAAHAANVKAIEKEMRKLPQPAPVPVVPEIPGATSEEGRQKAKGKPRQRGRGGRGKAKAGEGGDPADDGGDEGGADESGGEADADGAPVAALSAAMQRDLGLGDGVPAGLPPPPGKAAAAAADALTAPPLDAAPEPPPPPTAEEIAAAKAAAAKVQKEVDRITAANKKLETKRNDIKARLKREQEGVRKNAQIVGNRKGSARRDAWDNVRIVACTAASALQVSRRLQRDMKEVGEKVDKEEAEARADLKFDFVILDEAAAMMEPDAIGCLLHGARAILLVGDQNQLPPFSKWRDADTAKYTVSLMARLVNPELYEIQGKAKKENVAGLAIGAGTMPKRGSSEKGLSEMGKKKGSDGDLKAKGEEREKLRHFMLIEQYRMHPNINQVGGSAHHMPPPHPTPIIPTTPITTHP